MPLRTFVDIDCPNPNCRKPIVTELIERSGKKIIHCLHCGGGFSVDESMFVAVYHSEDLHECPHCKMTLQNFSDHLAEMKPLENRKKKGVA